MKSRHWYEIDSGKRDAPQRIYLTCASGLPYGYAFGRDSMLGKFGVNPTLPSQL
jgi:hypothetical protein